ncbi:MAG: 30S ribosome-binding factor RbfA [Candidatus Omnitrophota bacterium]|jgi:ribosome-binding factor A
MARQDKVAEAIREEASLIIHDKLKDPRIGFVTITRVEVASDLRNASIFFSVLGNEEDYAKTQEALDSALGYIRKLISERINLKFAPEMIFRQDRSSEYSVRIQEILEEVKELDKDNEENQTEKPAKRKRKAAKVEPKKRSRSNKKK